MMAIDPQAETQADSGEPSQTHSGGQSRIEAFLGKTLKGKYRIDRVLGQGAMGVVFGGTQLGLDKPVAVKMMRPDSFHSVDSLDRFRREATVVSKLNHPGIAQVLDFGIEAETPFLVMEFVDGKELTDVMATEGPMPPARAVAVIRQLASALEEAHKNGVVHRDIKPHKVRSGAQLADIVPRSPRATSNIGGLQRGSSAAA
jgi:serine/threonine-protein kinase